MRSLPQPLTRGWHLLLQSFTNHSSSSLVGQRAAPICGSLLHPHPFRVSKRAALWCTARHSALNLRPLGHRHQLPVQISCLAHLTGLSAERESTAISAQPAALWALGSEVRQFTARGCHLHTAKCLAPQVSVWRVPENTSRKLPCARVDGTTWTRLMSTGLGTLHPSTRYIWRRVDASPQQGAGTTLSPQFPHAQSALARGNTPSRSQTHKHKPQAAPKAESCLW